MDEKQIRLSIKILTLLTTAYLTSGIIVQFVRGSIPVEIYSSSFEETTPVSVKKVSPLDSYAPVWESNIFNPPGAAVGTEVMPEVSEAVEEEVKNIPLSSLKYKLVGTVVGLPENSFAIVNHLDKKEQSLYRIGGKLDSAEIVKIDRNRVILNNAGREEMLEVEFDEKVLAAKGSGKSVSQPAGAIKKVSANKFILDKGEVEKLSGDISQFMTQVRIVPNMLKGKSLGYKLMNIKKGSLVETVGLRNGDVVREVNGKAIDKPEQAFLAYQQLIKGAGFTLDVDRNGKRETIYYEIK